MVLMLAEWKSGRVKGATGARGDGIQAARVNRRGEGWNGANRLWPGCEIISRGALGWEEAIDCHPANAESEAVVFLWVGRFDLIWA